MYSNDFEDAFSQFLEAPEYDEAVNYLFSAGWVAAGGDPPNVGRIFQLFPGGGKEKI